MAAFKGRMLTAEELVRYRRKPQTHHHVKNEKIFAPTGSWLEGKQVQTLLGQTKGLLEIERVERGGSLSQAEWDENMGVAHVTKCVGRQFEKFGYQENSAIHLYPEEALFLLESNRLDLCHAGVSMSLQQAYNTLLSSKTNFSLLEYRVFSHFLKHGFKLLRHSPKRTITAYERQIGLSTVIEKRIRNAKNFRKGIATKRISCSEGIQGNKTSDSNSKIPNVADSNFTDQGGVRKENYVVSQSEESEESDIEILSELCGACRDDKVSSVVESSSSDDSDCRVVFSGSGKSVQSTVKVKSGIELIDLDDSNSESRLSEVKEVEVSSIKIESSECIVVDSEAKVTPVPCDINLGNGLVKRTEGLSCSSVCNINRTVESSNDFSIHLSSLREMSKCGASSAVERDASQQINATGSPCPKDFELRDLSCEDIGKIRDTDNNNLAQLINPHILNDETEDIDTYRDVSQQAVGVKDKLVLECNRQSLDSSQQASSHLCSGSRLPLEKRIIESGNKTSQSTPDDCSLVLSNCSGGSGTVDVKCKINLEVNSDIKSELFLAYQANERTNDLSNIEKLNVENNCEIDTFDEHLENICKIEKQALEPENSSEMLTSRAKMKEMLIVKIDKFSNETEEIEVVDLDDENSKEVEEEEEEANSDDEDVVVQEGEDEPHVVYVGDKCAEKARNAILESFPDCAGRKIIYCKAPSKHLLPPNVSPVRKEYKIVLRRLVDPGIGGRPEQYFKKAGGSKYFSPHWSNVMRNNQRPSFGFRQHNGRIGVRVSHCGYFQGRQNYRSENSFLNPQNCQPLVTSESERMERGPWMNFSPGRRSMERNSRTNFSPEQIERENNPPWINYVPGTEERHQNNPAWRDTPLNRDGNNHPWSNFPPEGVEREHLPPWVLQREQNAPPWDDFSPERGHSAPPWTAFSSERGQNSPAWISFPPGGGQNNLQCKDFSSGWRERGENLPSLSYFPPETLNRNQNSPSCVSFPPEGAGREGRPHFNPPNRSSEWGRYPQNSYRRCRGPRRRGTPRRRGGRQDQRWSYGHSFNSQDENNVVQQNFETNALFTDQNGKVFPDESLGQHRGRGRNGGGSYPSHDVQEEHVLQGGDGQQNTLQGVRGQRSGRKRRGGRSSRRGRGSPPKRLRSDSQLQSASDLGERVSRFLARANAVTDQPSSSESSCEESASDVQSCSSSSCETTESSSDEDEAEQTHGKKREHIAPLVKPDDYGNIEAVMKALQIIPSSKLGIRKPLPAKRLQIKFDLYLPSTVFRKSEPPVPDYRVVIMRPQDDIPSSHAIALLQHGFEDDVPLLFVLSSLDSVNIFMYSDVELPVVAGNERLF